MKNWKVTKQDGASGISLRTVDRELIEKPATAFDSTTTHDKDGRPLTVEMPEVRFFPFAKPGRPVATKRLYTIKGEKADGTLIQIPLEDQINNNIASPENAIGLQLYSRRGINVFFDFETGEAAFCPTWDCWAQWNKEFDGFCSDVHREITKGETQNAASSGFGAGATTSRTWG